MCSDSAPKTKETQTDKIKTGTKTDNFSEVFK